MVNFLALLGWSLDGETTLIDRATHALYAPGSTFKIVTLATALENTWPAKRPCTPRQEP